MMKKFSILLVSIIFLNSCSTYYSSVSLEKISSQKKLTAEKFAQTLFKKCREKDYSEFKGFNISKQFEMFLVKDSLKKQCEKIEKKYGNITVLKLTSAHTAKHPQDIMDVLNFNITTEKISKPLFLHIGMHRDQDFVDRPFVINDFENYFGYKLKQYRKSKKK